ncbi:beta-ureidopropionase [Anaeramoeba ignava]|uniref:Beta-ureidopropionase n=1 Tax=Anaeramoeba ignava TaxID=1746090 RepID=A0A9Q0RD59_ANAIG|nr:beta-ureidopropionase [Anaeramoeba ignava]
MEKIQSLEAILDTIPDENDRKEAYRILYGKPSTKIELPEEVEKIAKESNFDIKGWKFVPALEEETRKKRLVRIGAIQNSIVLPTDKPILEQLEAIHKKIGKLIEAAAMMNVNVCCLQESWPSPFFFCTREKFPWLQFAQDVFEGPSVKFCCQLAKQFNMVIVCPIIERDTQHQDIIWNTAVVVSNHGEVIGYHRKNHIPRVGDFNESTYYMEGNTGHPVFDTEFGKLELIFCNFGALSEPLWPIEARNAAIANSYFTVAINRIGTEEFPNEFTSGDGQKAHKDFGHFYGSTYVAGPDGTRTPGLSRIQDGLLVTEVDLNLITQVKDKWSFQMTQRLSDYAQLLKDAADLNFQRQIIKPNKK